MGRSELGAIENGSIGEASEDMFFRLGMMYSTGAEVPTDYVSAHKWFNLAAMRGNAEAIRRLPASLRPQIRASGPPHGGLRTFRLTSNAHLSGVGNVCAGGAWFEAPGS